MNETIAQSVKDRADNSDIINDTMAKAVTHAVDAGALRFAARGLRPQSGVVDNIKEMQDEFGEWNILTYGHEAVGWALYMCSEHSLTMSEAKCLAYIADKGHFRIEDVERRETPDFVVQDNVGIEVKSNENYSISRKQLLSADEYRPFHIYYSSKKSVRLMDVIDWIGLNQYRDIA